MAIPSASAVLAAWERGAGQDRTHRGLTLLALTEPEADIESLAALSLGERDRHLLMLRETWFGPRMTGLMSCPRCRAELEIELATAALRAMAQGDPAGLTLRGDTHEIHLRLADSRDLMAAADRSLEVAARTLLRACVVSAVVDGVSVEPEALPCHLIAQASGRLSDADPLADFRLDLSCTCCDCHWQAPFDIVSFLWSEINDWANRTLREIHALACAYGWSEREILSLSPARRRSYLRMVDG